MGCCNGHAACSRRTGVWLLSGQRAQVEPGCLKQAHLWERLQFSHPPEPTPPHWPPGSGDPSSVTGTGRGYRLFSPEEQARETRKGDQTAGGPANVPSLLPGKQLSWQNSFLKKCFIAAVRHSRVQTAQTTPETELFKQ